MERSTTMISNVIFVLFVPVIYGRPNTGLPLGRLSSGLPPKKPPGSSNTVGSDVIMPVVNGPMDSKTTANDLMPPLSTSSAALSAAFANFDTQKGHGDHFGLPPLKSDQFDSLTMDTKSVGGFKVPSLRSNFDVPPPSPSSTATTETRSSNALPPNTSNLMDISGFDMLSMNTNSNPIGNPKPSTSIADGRVGLPLSSASSASQPPGGLAFSSPTESANPANEQMSSTAKGLEVSPQVDFMAEMLGSPTGFSSFVHNSKTTQTVTKTSTLSEGSGGASSNFSPGAGMTTFDTQVAGSDSKVKSDTRPEPKVVDFDVSFSTNGKTVTDTSSTKSVSPSSFPEPAILKTESNKSVKDTIKSAPVPPNLPSIPSVPSLSVPSSSSLTLSSSIGGSSLETDFTKIGEIGKGSSPLNIPSFGASTPIQDLSSLSSSGSSGGPSSMSADLNKMSGANTAASIMQGLTGLTGSGQAAGALPDGQTTDYLVGNIDGGISTAANPFPWQKILNLIVNSVGGQTPPQANIGGLQQPPVSPSSDTFKFGDLSMDGLTGSAGGSSTPGNHLSFQTGNMIGTAEMKPFPPVGSSNEIVFGKHEVTSTSTSSDTVGKGPMGTAVNIGLQPDSNNLVPKPNSRNKVKESTMQATTTVQKALSGNSDLKLTSYEENLVNMAAEIITKAIKRAEFMSGAPKTTAMAKDTRRIKLSEDFNKANTVPVKQFPATLESSQLSGGRTGGVSSSSSSATVTRTTDVSVGRGAISPSTGAADSLAVDLHGNAIASGGSSSVSNVITTATGGSSGTASTSSNTAINVVVDNCNTYFRDLQDKRFFFVQTGYGRERLRCPPGTSFNEQRCDCSDFVQYQYGPEVCDPDIIMNFTDGHIVDVSGNEVPVYAEQVNVSSSRDAILFTEKSSLIVWMYTNFDFRDKYMIKLRFMTVHQGGNNQVLISNCEWGVQEPSIGAVLYKAKNEIHVHLRTVGQKTDYLIFNYDPVGWNRLEMLYDGSEFSTTLNNIKKSIPVTGIVEIQDAPLVIGHCERYNRFHGYVDDFSVYSCVPPKAAGVRTI